MSASACNELLCISAASFARRTASPSSSTSSTISFSKFQGWRPRCVSGGIIAVSVPLWRALSCTNGAWNDGQRRCPEAGFAVARRHLTAKQPSCWEQRCRRRKMPGVFGRRLLPPGADAASNPALKAESETARHVPDLWRHGPAEVSSAAALRVLYLLRFDPLLLLFDATLKEELVALQQERTRDRRLWQAAQADKPSLWPKDVLVLRRRVSEVRASDRSRAVAELLYLMVCGRFKHLEVPLLPPLKAGGDARFGNNNQQLLGLTEVYSFEALEMVRDHLYSVVDRRAWESQGNNASVRVGLFQAGQVYAMSALFGYYLRRVDARYQLEKLAWSLGVFDEGEGTSQSDHAVASSQRSARKRPAPSWMEPSWTEGEARADLSLKDYIEGFDPKQVSRIQRIASAEARAAMEAQVTGLFGDLRLQRASLLEAVGMVKSSKEASLKLQWLVATEKVASIRLTGGDLRRLVLEAVAFGALLCDSEKEADSVYELTQRTEHSFDGDD